MLFCGDEGGGETWAILALRFSTRQNSMALDPETWLTDVLERIVSGATKDDQLHELLAWNWKAAREAETKQGGGMTHELFSYEKPMRFCAWMAQTIMWDQRDRWSDRRCRSRSRGDGTIRVAARGIWKNPSANAGNATSTGHADGPASPRRSQGESAQRPHAYASIFMRDQGQIYTEDWTIGFMLGVGMRDKAWTRILTSSFRAALAPSFRFIPSASTHARCSRRRTG